MSLYARLAALLVIVLALAGLWWKVDRMLAAAKQDGVDQEHAVWVQADERRLEQEAQNRAALDQQKKDSDRETRRLLDRAQDERAVADAAAGKLRNDLAAFVAAAKRADPAPVGQRPPADSALDLLANLYARADDEAGVLADYADRARIAGQQCERDYEALTAPR